MSELSFREQVLEDHLPEGLNEIEEAFFRKWFDRLSVNSDRWVEEYETFVKNSGSSQYRDLIWGFHNKKKIIEIEEQLKYTTNNDPNNSKRLVVLNEVKAVLWAADFLVDEYELNKKLGKPDTDLRPVDHALQFLKKRIDSDGTSEHFDSKVFEKYVRLSEKYYPDAVDERKACLTVALNSPAWTGAGTQKFLKKKFKQYGIA